MRAVSGAAALAVAVLRPGAAVAGPPAPATTALLDSTVLRRGGRGMARPVLAIAGAAALLGACATRPEAPSGPPSVAESPGLPAPPQARFYADCVAQAVARGDYDREAELDVLRFRCDGRPARAFYDGLGPWSAKIGSELVAEGRTWRFGSKMERDPSGLDHCSKGGGEDWRCTVVLNVGEFLSFSP